AQDNGSAEQVTPGGLEWRSIGGDAGPVGPAAGTTRPVHALRFNIDEERAAFNLRIALGTNSAFLGRVVAPAGTLPPAPTAWRRGGARGTGGLQDSMRPAVRAQRSRPEAHAHRHQLPV